MNIKQLTAICFLISNPLTSFSSTQLNCELIGGYKIGTNIENFKDSYPKSLSTPSCAIKKTYSNTTAVDCSGQMAINEILTSVTFSFDNNQLFGIDGDFDISDYAQLKQIFIQKFGTPKGGKGETEYEGWFWKKDGIAILLGEMRGFTGHRFSFMPLDQKKMKACMRIHR